MIALLEAPHQRPAISVVSPASISITTRCSGGGQLLSALIPALAGSAGGVDLASIAGQLVGGGVSGAIVTAIVAMILNAMNKR